MPTVASDKSTDGGDQKKMPTVASDNSTDGGININNERWQLTVRSSSVTCPFWHAFKYNCGNEA